MGSSRRHHRRSPLKKHTRPQLSTPTMRRRLERRLTATGRCGVLEVQKGRVTMDQRHGETRVGCPRRPLIPYHGGEGKRNTRPRAELNRKLQPDDRGDPPYPERPGVFGNGFRSRYVYNLCIYRLFRKYKSFEIPVAYVAGRVAYCFLPQRPRPTSHEFHRSGCSGSYPGSPPSIGGMVYDALFFRSTLHPLHVVSAPTRGGLWRSGYTRYRSLHPATGDL